MIFYLKVNREEDYAFRNIQHWIDIIEIYEGNKVFFVCDKERLEKSIIERIDFKNADVEFIKSYDDSSPLREIVSEICDEFWTKAGYAHLTTFWHAKLNGYKYFWNIDADDTLFCLEPYRVKQALVEVQEYAIKQASAVFSLDMWRSMTNGWHWSFGVSFINNTYDWMEIFRENMNKEYVKASGQPMNLDGFFTAMKNNTDLKIDTFYFENMKFVHFSDNFFKRPISSGMYYWKDDKLILPILYYCIGARQMGQKNIFKDVMKFDIDIKESEALTCLLKNNKGVPVNIDTELKYYQNE